MKKSIVVSLLAALSLGLCGCGAEGSVVSSEKSSKPAATAEAVSEEAPASSEAATEAIPETTDAPEQATEAAIDAENNNEPSPEAASDWKSAYKLKLTEFMNGDIYNEESAWDLRDIDNDGVPELLISRAQFHAAGVEFYRYDGGEAKPLYYADGRELEFGFYGRAMICPGEKLLGEVNMHMGYNYSVEYKYDNGVASHVQTTCEDSGAVGEEEVTYTVNDEEVDKAAYDKAVEEFGSHAWVEVGAAYSFDDLSPLY